MNLRNKKKLIARTMNVGKDRIIIRSIEEIKEAITRQDIIDLVKSGIIIIKDEKGRKKTEKRNSRRRAGSIRKKVNKRKREYIHLTRKLRRYIKNQKAKIGKEKYSEIRRKIKSKNFRSLGHLQGYMEGKE